MKSDNKYHIYDTISELYEKTILSNYGKILRHISNYIGNRSDVLESKNPGLRCLYTPANENDFYDSAGLDKETVKSILAQSSELPNSHLLIEPVKQFYHLYTLLHVISSIFYNNQKYIEETYYKDGKKHTPAHKIIEIYFTIRMYSIQQIRIFKFVPKQETMEYVINNLSNRFELASAPNLFSIFERYSETNTESMQYDIKRPSDLMMYEYTNKMNNRIKMFLKKLFLEWRRVYESGKSSGVQELSAVNDEGKQFDLIADNVSSIIEVNSIKILNNFVQDKNINVKLLKLACRNSGKPSETKAKMVIQKIRDSKDETLLKEMIMCILSYWLISMRQEINTIHSKEFIVTCSAAYAISNTVDKYIIRLKDILQELISKYTMDIIDTERKATLISFKKCIHIYTVLYIASIN